MFPSPCKRTQLTPVPLERLSTLRSSPTRFHRPRRILYPASRSRRPSLTEAPDPAHRWLLLLSVLIFLQIYTEEEHTCTELQSSSMVATTCGPPEADVSQGEAHSSTQDESWRNQPVDPEHQMECVVA